MGYYYNPPEDVSKVGRKLSDSPRYADLMRQLRPDELLVSVYDKAMFLAAPALYSAEEFAAHEATYESGFALHRRFFAMTRDQFAKGGDRAPEQQRAA